MHAGGELRNTVKGSKLFKSGGLKRDTDVQNRLLDSMGEGEGGMI